MNKLAFPVDYNCCFMTVFSRIPSACGLLQGPSSIFLLLSILGVWYQDQSILFTPELCAKKEEKREDVLMSSYQMPHADYFFSLMATGQNLQYGGRALFPLFIYLYNICTDFLLNMKDELTSGMPENTEVILFACFSIWGFFFFF